jgi:hypothetical protein
LGEEARINLVECVNVRGWVRRLTQRRRSGGVLYACRPGRIQKEVVTGTRARRRRGRGEIRAAGLEVRNRIIHKVVMQRVVWRL